MKIHVSVISSDEEITSCYHPPVVNRRFVSVNFGDLCLMMNIEQAKRLAEVTAKAVKEAGA